MRRLFSGTARMSQQRVLRSLIAKAGKGWADGRPILDFFQSPRSSSRFVICTSKTPHLQLRPFTFGRCQLQVCLWTWAPNNHVTNIYSTRSFTVKKAESLNLTGHVTNTSDGKVLPYEFFELLPLFKGYVEAATRFIFHICFLIILHLHHNSWKSLLPE